MKVRFAVLADYVNVTQEGKINILGVFDFIYAAQFPTNHHEMQLVMRFEADITERGQQKELQVLLIDQQGEKVLELNGRMTIGDAKPGDLLLFNQVLTFRNIAFKNEGDYQFDIYVDGALKSNVQLKVVAPPDQHKI